MGIVIEMCNCTDKKNVIPNSKSMIENDISQKYNNNNDNNQNEINIDLTQEIKDQKNINKNIINNEHNEQNNEAETYNNIQSMVIQKERKEKSSLSRILIQKIDKDDKMSQKSIKSKASRSNKSRKSDKSNKSNKSGKGEEEDNNKKFKRKKSKNKIGERKISSDEHLNNKNDIIINEEDYKEIVNISETIVSEIIINEKPKTISKEKKKKIKGRNIINIFILGYNEVGKSAFCIRFVENKYEDFYIPSIGIENYSKIIAYNERSYKLNFSVLWGELDAQKQENLLSTIDFFFLIYDITKIISFNQINIYLKQLKKYLFLYDKEGKSPNFCLIGNKCDLEGERKVGLETINKCIAKFGIKHFDISVRTAKNMNNLIQFFIGIFDKIAFPEK